MREVAFLIGFGMPPDSPSPYEALANGAAYLQIKCKCADKSVKSVPFNTGLYEMWDFHMCTIIIRECNDTKTATNVVAVAEQAYNNPFPSYIPSQHSAWNSAISGVYQFD